MPTYSPGRRRVIAALALTSISEAQPLVILEAGAAGVPTVATDVGACREMIEGPQSEVPPLGPGGAIVGLLIPSGASVPPRSQGFPLLVLVAAAVLPDIDFLWERHNMETHNLKAAVLTDLTTLTWSRDRDFQLAWSMTLT